MKDETKKLLKEIKTYRDDMVARNYPFQRISDIIAKWETKEVPDKDFLDEAEREKKELEESYKESVRQAKQRRNEPAEDPNNHEYE